MYLLFVLYPYQEYWSRVSKYKVPPSGAEVEVFSSEKKVRSGILLLSFSLCSHPAVKYFFSLLEGVGL